MPRRRASLLAPLDRFYAPSGVALPAVETVADREVPAALRRVLTTSGPLTPSLEDHHGECLTLRVLERRRTGHRYARRVVLMRTDGTPVVLGAIAIDLRRLPPASRAAVLAEQVPFGHIVPSAVARPDALLRIACDEPIADALELPARGPWLYGRRRTVVDERRATLASILEILAPDPETLRARRLTPIRRGGSRAPA